jgi:hypothetical protein
MGWYLWIRVVAAVAMVMLLIDFGPCGVIFMSMCVVVRPKVNTVIVI